MTIGSGCDVFLLRLLVLLVAVALSAAIDLLLRSFSPAAAIALEQDGAALAVAIITFVAVVLSLFLLYATVRIAIVDDRWRQVLDDAAEMQRAQRDRGPQG